MSKTKINIDGHDYFVKTNKFELMDIIKNFETFDIKRFNHLTEDEFIINQARFIGDVRRNAILPKEFKAVYDLCHKRKGKKVHLSYYGNTHRPLSYLPLFKTYELSFKLTARNTVELTVYPVYFLKF